MKINIKIYLLGIYSFICVLPSSYAQTEKKDSVNLWELNLEDLMNISIVSASKKEESLFDAPFSASVITKEEIKKAGCTSIMEVFRLMPGLIVRQQSNGNFDIHIRGLDNVHPNSLMVNSASTTTLVMIDNRPVYNYLQGGTFWESLPIDLNDIEKIEVVRGPSSAMYGPNAVTGVIHIITRKPEKEGLYAIANGQYGSNNTLIGNASLGYQFNPRLSLIVSNNYQTRDRNKVEYYRLAQNDFVDTPDSIGAPNPSIRYPHARRSMYKYGTNIFLNYTPSDKININFTTGHQNSEVQNAYGENRFTTLSTSISETKYADLKLGVHGFTGQFSYLDGKQDPMIGFIGSTYDFKTLDGFIEYELKVKNLTFKPGYNFRKAIYDDTKYWDSSIKEGIINGQKEIITNAFSLRTEYKLFNDKLKLFGGIRLDKFNYPRKAYFSYQFSANYSINDNNLLRVVYSKANRSPFIYDSYLDITVQSTIALPSPPFPPNTYAPITAIASGNKELKLVTSQMVELGYRAKLATNFQLDMDVFGTKTTNYTELIQGRTDMTTMPLSSYFSIENLPLEAYQLGYTLSLNYILNNFQFKPFFTTQYTQLNNYSSYYNSPEASPSSTNLDPINNNYLMGKNYKHKGTPAIYGGAYLDFQVNSKFNINLNSYYYSSQTFYYRSNADYRDNIRGIDNIKAKLIMNARIAYKPIEQLDIFISGKNILGSNSREFFKSDKIGATYLAGLNFEF